jgi:hypothetical protein
MIGQETLACSICELMTGIDISTAKIELQTQIGDQLFIYNVMDIIYT